MQIVHQICLHPVNHLEKSLLVRLRLPRFLTACLLRLPQILPHMVRVGKGLHDPVIGDGDRRMPPFVGALHDIFRLRDAVHIAHLRMTVKLHPLSDASVLAGCRKVGDFLNACKGADGQFMVELIDHSHALDLDKRPLFHNTCYFINLLISHEKLHRHGVRIIRDIIDQNGPLVLDLPLVLPDHPAAYHHFAHFAYNILDGHCLLLEVPAVNHIRVVGAFQRTFIVALLPVPAAGKLFGRERAPAAAGQRRMCRTPGRICLSRASELPRIPSAGLSRIPRLPCAGLPRASRLPCASSRIARQLSRRQFSPLHVHGKTRSRRDLRHLYCQTALFLLAVFARRLLFIGKFHLHRDRTTLVIYFFQNPRKLPALFPAKHRIFQCQQQFIRRKGHIRPPEQAVFYRGRLLQFQQDALSVSVHQLLRVILRRERKVLIKLDDHRHIREKLSPDLPLHPKYILLVDQMVRRDINAQKILPSGTRHLLHGDVLKQILQPGIQF